MKLLVLIVFLLLTCPAFPQINLVLDGSFESGNCPNGFGQLPNATMWTSPTDGTPDLFRICAPWAFKAPGNAFGYQFPLSGDSYCGIISFQSGNFREYVQCELLDSMEQGKRYILSLNLSLSNFSNYGNKTIGVLFTDTLLNLINNGRTINATPQIEKSISNLIDTLNWINITDTIFSQGGERFMTIGCFKNDEYVDTTVVSGNLPHAYYYLDDVSLIKDTTTQIDELQAIDVSVSPNPFNNSISILSKENLKLSIFLYNIHGQIVYHKTINENETINLEFLSGGVYNMELFDDKYFFLKKIIKINN